MIALKHTWSKFSIFFLFLFSTIQLVAQSDIIEFEHLLYLLSTDDKAKSRSMAYLHEQWSPTKIAPLLDIAYMTRDEQVRKEIFQLLRKKTKQSFKSDPLNWMTWYWSEEQSYPPYYADLKAELFKHFDPRFETYFKRRQELATIRLDEVLWGGVEQDGIPPLRNPKLIAASEEKYLYKNDVVYGVVINGEARAYPQRILAWHEMVIDTLGGFDIAGVYCTLCGTVIVYNTEHKGTKHELGTSGFLYRSNKLMYDKATQSLWNTVAGQPVIGPLVRDSIQLDLFPVVTTTWKAWKALHPQTTVLSLNTGHNRNYSPGMAYRAYFATDNLMFPVPQLDNRLRNKDEVFIIRSPGLAVDPLAISTAFLKKNSIYHDSIQHDNIVVLTDANNISKAYYTDDFQFISYNKDSVKDTHNRSWLVTEEYLIDKTGRKLERIPAHAIFWFAWYNFYPSTRLVL